MPKVHEIHKLGHKIIATNFLEVNKDHNQALSIIWYIKF